MVLPYLDRALDVASQRNASNIALSVSSKKPELLPYYKEKGFHVVSSVVGKYQKEVTEYFLSRPVNMQLHKRQRVDSNDVKNVQQSQTSSSSVSSTSSVRPSVSQVRQPSTHTCTLRQMYIRQIANGHKTHEGRVNTEYFRNYQQGDTVKWEGGPESVTTKILSRREFRSFEDMLTTIGHQKFLPETRNLEEAVRVYNGIPGYADKVRRFGALALEVAPVPRTESSSVSTQTSFSPFAGVKRAHEGR